MSEGDRPRYCEQCGSLAEVGDRFCGVCGARITPNAPDATTREIPKQVQPPQGVAEDQVTSPRNNRAFLVAGVVGVVLLLLVGGGALAFVGLSSATGLLGGTDPEPASPANTQETTTSLLEPTIDTTSDAPSQAPNIEEPCVEPDEIEDEFRIDRIVQGVPEEFEGTELESYNTLTIYATDVVSTTTSGVMAPYYVAESCVNDGEYDLVVFVAKYTKSSIPRTTYFPYGDDDASDLLVELEAQLYDQREDTSSSDNDGDTDTGGGANSPDDSEEASLDQAVEDYYRAVGVEDWEYTYNHLDSQTQSMFTEEEWSQKNQWFWDRYPTVYHILSIESDGESEGSVADVEVRLTGEDGSSWVRNTYWVLEDGEWLHRFSQEETDLFMPDATFEEFVEAQTDASS